MASEACGTEAILRPIGGRALRSSADYGGKPVRLLAALAGLGFRGPLRPFPLAMRTGRPLVGIGFPWSRHNRGTIGRDI